VGGTASAPYLKLLRLTVLTSRPEMPCTSALASNCAQANLHETQQSPVLHHLCADTLLLR
jgi:hypothetical protein